MPNIVIDTSLQTLLDFLRWGISQMNANTVYFGHGTDNSEDEAMLLLSDTLHLPYPIKPEYLNARLTDDEKKQLLALFQRRIQEKIPVPYLIHKAWFCGLEFYVDPHVLIPRSPIAELIENQFYPWIDASLVNNILDLCTGSACIAIACAHAFSEAHVDAVDICPDALEVAAKNIELHQCRESVSLWQSDLFEALPPKAGYDIIVSNPPYVSAAELASLPAEYQHEPTKALLSYPNSPDGLEIVKKILAEASRYLSPHGILIVEVGNAEEALIDQYPDVPFLWLDFEHGGTGVFLLTAQQCKDIAAP
jgi:ribosomal protein L3 glutamine methyltransferase